MIFTEIIEGLWELRHLGMPPLRILRGKSRKNGADIFGIGDNGLEAVNRLMGKGLKGVDYLVLHRELRKLAQTKADTIAMKDGSWEGIETFMTAPFESFPKSFQKFQIYYNMNLQGGHPTFVLADLSEACGRETAPAAAKDSDLGGRRKIAVVHVPQFETLISKKKKAAVEHEVCRSFRSLCHYTRTVIAMSDLPKEEAESAKATVKRQSDFVVDLLYAMQGGVNAALKWQEVEAFLSGSALRGNLWQAWSSEGADVRSAMVETRQVLVRGGVLQKAKRVFVMIAGKAGLVDLQDVQGAMDGLAAAIEEDAEVMLHVNSEEEFVSGVRVNMAVKVEMG